MPNMGTDWSIDKAGGAFRYDGDGKLIIKPLPSKRGMVQKILKAQFESGPDFQDNHFRVKRMMRHTKKVLVRDYILAEKIIADRIAKKLGRVLAQKIGL